MYAQLKDIDLPISRLLSTKDGVDEFTAYKGQNNLYKYTSDMIAEITKFLKKLHIEYWSSRKCYDDDKDD